MCDPLTIGATTAATQLGLGAFQAVQQGKQNAKTAENTAQQQRNQYDQQVDNYERQKFEYNAVLDNANDARLQQQDNYYLQQGQFRERVDAAADQNKYHAENEAAAHAAFEMAVNSLSRRESQEVSAAATQKVAAGLSERAAESRASVAAGEAGVSGFSVDRIIGDLHRRGLQARDTIDQNTAMAVRQLEDQKLAEDAQMKSRVASVRTATGPSTAPIAPRAPTINARFPRSPTAPTPPDADFGLGTALQIGSAALGAATTGIQTYKAVK